jgi:peptidoglycan/LPS O-acetylase OafA/YrhL
VRVSAVVPRQEAGQSASGVGLGAARVSALTGLRGLAASSVVLYHVWLYGGPAASTFEVGPLHRLFTNLDSGVTFFFVLSGLLLYRSYARSLITGSGWPSSRNFAIARLLRIVPAYWLILIVTVALTQSRMFDHPLRIVANALFLQYAIPSFLPYSLASSNGSIAIVPSWSLGVEAGFYLCLPFVAAAGRAFATRTDRRTVAVFLPPALLAIVGGASIALEHLLRGNVMRDWQLAFPIHGGFFAAGMAGTAIVLLWQQGRVRLSASTKLALVLSALLLAALSVKIHHRGWLTWVDYQWLIAISISAFLLLILIAPEHNRLQRFLGSRAFVFSGLASYSIFLVHDQMIRALRDQSLASQSTYWFVAELCIVGIGTAIAAFASYQLVEKPSFALKRRLTRDKPRRSEENSRAQPPEQAANARERVA